jgi:hypothetical protein
MRHTPFDTEIAMFETMTAAERMQYATTRMIECEEVWSLGDENGWLIRDVDDRQLISIWPYRQLAMEHVPEGSESPIPQATSLEYFVYGVLDMCQQDDIWLEVFPGREKAGMQMRAADLFEIMNGMLETNEYFIEG